MLRTPIERLCAAATAAMLVPVWLVRWFPTQDGPSHLYNALLLARLGDTTGLYFVRNLTLFPNWTSYALMAALAHVAPPLVVQQIVVSLCVVAIPAASLYLQKSFKEAADPSALLGVLLAYSYVLFMGFFNFVLGSALFAVAVGFWWRHRERPPLVVLYALLAATYLSHGLPFAAAVGAIAILALLERRWRTALHLAPALLLLGYDVLSRLHATREYRSLAWHLRELAALGPFHIFNRPVAIAIAIILAIGILVTAARRRPAGWPGGVPPPALVTLALIIGFFVAPWGYGAHQPAQGEWISDRLLYLAVLTLPAWLNLPRPRIAATILLVLIALHLGTTYIAMRQLNARIATFADCAPALRPHTTLDVVGQRPDLTPRIAAALHAPAYLAALQPDVVYLADYEARLAEFPIAFRRDAPARPPDYLLVWRSARVRNVVGYRTICETADYRLMAR